LGYVNPRLTAVTGYTAAEVFGRSPSLLKSGETPPETYRDLWETITHGRVWSGDLRNRRKNGEVFLETAIIAPLVDEAGKPTHYVALKDDITAQKRFEAESLAQLQKEREVSEMKSRFISLTSHEFRTPLTAVRSAAELLHLHGEKLGSERREGLFQRIDKAVLHMNGIL